MSKPTNIQQAEFVRGTYAHESAAGVSKDELIKPDYWAHVARQVPAGSIIQVVPEDQAFFAEYYVVAATSNSLTLKQIRYIKLEAVADESEVAEEDSHFCKVKWGSPTSKYQIIRKSDLAVVKSGIPTKEQAFADRRDYEQALLA